MSYIGKLTAMIGSAIVATTAVYAAPAAAQATRTWISGVGDDANPCSRTAPCKTFAGAISKTAAGGEINCLDSAGFGGVTITKSLVLNCVGVIGGVLVGGTNGITINAAATDVVVLSGLDIFGVSNAMNGVRFLNGAALHITDSSIRRFNSTSGLGVSFIPSSNAELFITDTIIADNGSSGGGGGIEVKPTGTGSAKVTLTNVQVENNFNSSVRVDTTGSTGAGVQLAITDSNFTGSGVGLAFIASGTPVITGALTGNTIANNTGVGIITNGANVTMRAGGNTIANNVTGVLAAGSSTLQSFGDNAFAGNTADGTFTGAVVLKK